MGCRISPITTKLHTRVETQNILKMKIFLCFRTALTNSDVFSTDLRTTELIISGWYIYYSATTLICSVNSRLKSSSIIKSRFSFSSKFRGSHNKVGYGPVFCGINSFDTLLWYLLLCLRTGDIHRKHHR